MIVAYKSSFHKGLWLQVFQIFDALCRALGTNPLPNENGPTVFLQIRLDVKLIFRFFYSRIYILLTDYFVQNLNRNKEVFMSFALLAAERGSASLPTSIDWNNGDGSEANLLGLASQLARTDTLT